MNLPVFCQASEGTEGLFSLNDQTPPSASRVMPLSICVCVCCFSRRWVVWS